MVMADSINQQILALLKDNPRGLSIREISDNINMNRNSVSSYLNVLLVSGKVEARVIGPSKVFYLSQRVPLSAMLDFYEDSVVVINSDYKIVQINDTCLRLAGKNREELVNKPYIDLFSLFFTDPETRIKEKINDGLHGKESSIDVSGSGVGVKTHFKVKFIPSVFADGETGVTVIAEDVSEKKLAEESVRESEALFSVLFEHMSDGVVLIDASGDIVKANPAAENILGLRRSDIEGRSYVSSDWDIIRPDGSPMPSVEMAGPRSMKEKKAVSGVVMGVVRPDEFVSWIVVDSVPILSDMGEVDLLVGTFRLLETSKEKTYSVNN